MLWDVEFIVAFTDGTWVSQSEVISDADIDESEGIELGFVNEVAKQVDTGTFFPSDEISFIGVLYYSEHEESDNDA